MPELREFVEAIAKLGVDAAGKATENLVVCPYPDAPDMKYELLAGGKGNRIRKNPTPASVTVESLAGLVSVVHALKDQFGLELDTIFVNVKDCRTIQVETSPVPPWNEKWLLATAVAPILIGPNGSILNNPFHAGLVGYMAQSTAMENIQAFFLPTESREALLQFIGSIAFEASADLEDDGVSQKVTVSKGARRMMEKVPQKIQLQSWMTFPEIEQPTLEYIVRIEHEKGMVLIRPSMANGSWYYQLKQEIYLNLATAFPVESAANDGPQIIVTM